MAKQEVAVKAETDLAVFEGIEDLADYQEHMTREDVSIPFIQILQQLSPQCVDGDPAFNDEAKPSMFHNTVTGDLTESKKNGFDFVPVYYKASFIEWITRAKGGGYVREYPYEVGMTAITARNENNQDIIQQGSPVGTPGNQLNLTHTHFIFRIKEDGGYEPGVMSMTSTQLKSSKNLNALISNNPITIKGQPMVIRFAHRVTARTEQRKNDQGIWYVWDFERVGKNIDPVLVNDARTFAGSVKAGEKNADYSQAASEGASAAPTATPLDEEVPF